MSFFSESESNFFFSNSQLGFWRIKFQPGKEPEFECDSVVNEIIGISEVTSAEERYTIFIARIHKDDIPVFHKFSQSIENNRTEIVFRYNNPKKGLLTLRSNGVHQSCSGNSSVFLGTIQNITETMQYEKDKLIQQLLASENRSLKSEIDYSEKLIHQVLKYQTCGIIAYKIPSHEILVMNDTAKQYYGLKPEENITLSIINDFKEKIVYDDELVTKSRLKQIKEPGDQVSFSMWIPLDSGVKFHILVTTQLVQMDNGDKVIISSLQNISALTQVQETNIHLEQQLEIINSMAHELQVTKEAALVSNEAKTRFLFNMSHDIRTPMNAIMGFTELLEKNINDEEKRNEYIRKIRNSNVFLLSILNNVLEIARIESGKSSIAETTWSTEQFNDTLFSVFEEQMERKGIKFIRSINVQHEYVWCDPVKLREVFLNVLSNAYKYTAPGGTVKMMLEEIPCEKEGYCYYRTTVTDTGIGMHKDFLPHIFEEFSRDISAANYKIEGTGLGMAIVKHLVELMDGTISVTSEQGVGSSFVVTLPHKISSKDSLIVDEKKIIDENQFKGKRVLLAEDNELNREIANEILTAAGFIVDNAEDGSICVEKLMKEKEGFYNIILMDIQMPNLNGYEATKKIRALPNKKLASIPIVAMTANAFEEDKREAYACGMNQHISKPISVEHLFNVLNQFF